MAEESDLEKTEAPTPHRVDKAREKGQVPRSRELTSILMLAAGVALLWLAGEPMARRLASMVANGMHFDHSVINDDRQMLRRLSSLLEGAFWAMLPIFGGLVLMALAAPLLLGGFLFSTEALKPNFGRLNPVAGLGRLFSSQVGAELLKAILKALLVGWVTWLFLDHYWPAMLRLMAAPTLPALGDALGMIAGCALLILLGLLPMAGFDVFWQIWSNLKKLRMTKQEIREEHKEQDGDPHIKARIRQQQRAMARRRMMADVPKADVIVTNPTHYAVALQYNDRMSAPKVLAKGAGEVALRIRELGGQHRVPLLEAPPLARALYRHSEIGQQIPATLYAAVAEVLAWVYQLKRWRTHGGLIPKKPVHLPVPDALDFKESTSNG